MKIVNAQSITQNPAGSQLHRTTATFLQCLAGGIFIGLMAQFSVPLPFSPIPITLQTFALYTLIIMQGQKKATYSVICYLIQATLGLPVLHGGIANPAWMFYPTAGYLLGFAGCAFVAGALLEKKQNPGFLWTILSLIAGQVVLYAMGTAYLSFFVGASQAYALGIAPFMLGAVIKTIAAACTSAPIRFVKTIKTLYAGGQPHNWKQ